MLAETVREAARHFGEQPAIVDVDGRSLSFTNLDRLSDGYAVGLASRGIGVGDVVAFCLPAVPEHYLVYAALAKLGAVTAAVNPRLTDSERAAVFESASAKLVLGEEDLPGLLIEGEAPPALPADPERPVVIVFTSGTTGTPKGAVFCGRQLGFITDTDVGPAWGSGGIALAGPALAHLGPMTKFPGALRRGTTQHLVPAWSAGHVLGRMAELRVTSFGGVPTQLALILRHPEFDSYDLSSVRALIIGGGPATPALVREARARFGVPLASRYSCTEAALGTGTAMTDPEEDAVVSVGRPQPGVTLSILTEPGGPPVAPGDVGHVYLASPAAMSGYWIDGRIESLRGGVETGDLGWVDEDGRLRLSGRSRERYVRGGFNVHPIEVEAVLADHPAVGAVCVVGTPDPVMGEIGTAVVVPVAGANRVDLTSLRAFAAERLASYKLPDRVVFRDALPLTAMDKVDRRDLEAQLTDLAGPNAEE